MLSETEFFKNLDEERDRLRGLVTVRLNELDILRIENSENVQPSAGLAFMEIHTLTFTQVSYPVLLRYREVESERARETLCAEFRSRLQHVPITTNDEVLGDRLHFVLLIQRLTVFTAPHRLWNQGIFISLNML